MRLKEDGTTDSISVTNNEVLLEVRDVSLYFMSDIRGLNES